MVLQEHQHQVDEALAAYDEALETGDPSQLGDNVLLPISSVASDSDILLSPNSDRNKVNGGTSHFNVRKTYLCLCCMIQFHPSIILGWGVWQ